MVLVCLVLMIVGASSGYATFCGNRENLLPDCATDDGILCGKSCDPSLNRKCQWTGTECILGDECIAEACKTCDQVEGDTSCMHIDNCKSPYTEIGDYCCSSFGSEYVCCRIGGPPIPEFSTYGIIAAIIIIGGIVAYYFKKKKQTQEVKK